MATITVVAAADPTRLIVRKGDALFVRSAFAPDKPLAEHAGGTVENQLEAMISKWG